MLRTVKFYLGLLLGVMAAGHALAFSIFGPVEGWQTTDKDYQGNWFLDNVSGLPGLELGASKNVNEGYRINTPVLTYAYDPSFVSYFGPEGVKAVDKAFAFMNSLPAVSRTSRDLSEFLTEGNQRVNQTAQSLGLLDMKSVMIHLLVEHMGLDGDPHVFELKDRREHPGCQRDYSVINRNWDPVTMNPSHYVNGTLYTYHIDDTLCAPGAPDVGSATEDAVDPEASTFTTVATPCALKTGGYYIALTRDDIGGMRWLYAKNQWHNEPLPSNTVAQVVGNSMLGPVVSSPFTLPIIINNNSTNSNTNGVAGTGTVTNVSTVAIRGGIEKITYRKMNYDSYLSTGYSPTIISYTIPVVSGYKVTSQRVTRRVTQPDILITAGNIGVLTFIRSGPENAALPAVGAVAEYGCSSAIGGDTAVYRTISWSRAANNADNGAPGSPVNGGPGIINPRMLVVFNNVGTAYYNSTDYFLTEEDNNGKSYTWGSFDGTTNDPIVFPNGRSLMELESQVLSNPGDNPQNIDSQ